MVLAILSGLFVGTSYIPFPPWALVFCLVPLWIEWHRNPNPKRVFLTGWVTQFLLSAIGFHWVAYTAMEHAHISWPLGVLALFGYCSIGSLHFPLSGLVWALIQKRVKLKITESALLLALLFWFFETTVFMIFPWNMGYPWMFTGLPVFQTAEIFGFRGLSLLTALANALCFFIWDGRESRKTVFRHLAVGIGLFAALNFLGLHLKNRLATPDKNLNVLTIQGNIGNLEKALAERGSQFRDPIIGKYFALTRTGVDRYPDADLVFLPETAIPIELDEPFRTRYYPARYWNFNREIKKPILTGAYSSELGSNRYYNALFLSDKDGNLKGEYRKSILLAFGEYFPGAQYLPFLKDLIPEISDFKTGTGPSIMEFGDLKIGPQICYEGIQPDFVLSVANLGAQIFFNVTNDSWFWRPFEPLQHMYMTLGRAIEFRRPLVRATNTGISTAVLADGTILARSPQDTEWIGYHQIPYLSQPPETAYQKYADAYFWFVIFVLLGLIGRAAVRKS